MRATATILIALALSTPAIAQHHGHHRHQQNAPGPYAGLQQREVKALSEQQIADLREGRGMGLALAAELNGYPGPMHVLELKDQLQLSAEQHQRFQQLFDTMKVEAIAAGEALIASERALDRAFSEGTITPDTLAALTADIGSAQGRLRAVHMKYHLTSADLLSHEQRQRYAELRGYR
jgi:hypothetical protein